MDVAKICTHAVLLLTLPTGLGPPSIQPLHPPLPPARRPQLIFALRLCGLKVNCSADSAEMALAMEKDSVWRGGQENGTFTLP